MLTTGKLNLGAQAVVDRLGDRHKFGQRHVCAGDAIMHRANDTGFGVQIDGALVSDAHLVDFDDLVAHRC
jgi:hypothetical protein